MLVHILLGLSLDHLGIIPGASNTLRFWLLAGLSVGAAAGSWRFLEKPIAELKPPLDGRRPG